MHDIARSVNGQWMVSVFTDSSLNWVRQGSYVLLDNSIIYFFLYKLDNNQQV